jgi:heme o synthase
MLKAYLDLTKSGIVIFVIFSGLVGFVLGSPFGKPFETQEIIIFLVGLYLLSSGSLAINQAQEWRLDLKMNRTLKRPIPSGKIKPWQAYILGFVFCTVGILLLLTFNTLAAGLGLFTVILYNLLYTLYWKKKWTFGAVPGAIPGALPVSIGFACQNQNLLDPVHLHVFLILFIWQMPHFWTLAIRFKDDYGKAGIPVLPYMLGVNRTIYHIGLYVFVYLAVALSAPFTIHASYVHFLIVLPFCIWVLIRFYIFTIRKEKAWLGFFLSVNFSLLAFLIAPLIDRWAIFYI